MEKIKVDLYVKGSILIDNSILQKCCDNQFNSIVSLDDKRYDFNEAIIIDGDLKCSSMTLNSSKVIAASKSFVIHYEKGD